MADGENWWGGWFQQSYQAVKEKSSEAFEFIKRDLTEFSTVVQHDTACSLVATATAVKNKLAVEGSSETTEKVKKSLSSFLGVITDTLAPPPDKTIDCDVITLVATPAGTTEVYDSSKARLYSLQADPATYCNEPDGTTEQFDNWLCSFSLEEKKGEISELLVNSPSIRALYTKMVPAAVSHSEFWQRYFYKVFQLDQEEARRVALKQRAEQSTHTETLGWEEEEEDDFLCATPTSYRSSLTPTLDQRPSTLTEPSLLTPVLSPSEERLSVSSDSVSLPTQIHVQPELLVTEQGKLMTEVSLEDITNTDDKPERVSSQPEANHEAETGAAETGAAETGAAETGAAETGAAVTGAAETGAAETGAAETGAAETGAAETGAAETGAAETGAAETGAAVKPEAVKEDGPQDIRVFELNSDSGKSTPSNNGKKGSSTDVSEDWEKDFDLDMTEEEVQMALSKIDASGEQLDEDWENWD